MWDRRETGPECQQVVAYSVQSPQLYPSSLEWALVWGFFLYIRPLLSSSRALRLTALSLHQCCRE